MENQIDIKKIISANAHLITEKIPIFLLSSLSSVMTFYAQNNGESVVSIDSLPFYFRVLNAVNSYVKYIFFMFYPVNLAIIYPYPKELSFYNTNTIFSVLFLFCMTLVVLWNIKTRAWLFAGWFFFLGTLVPVIGIVQVGGQAMADRYTYVPLIGLFIIIACGITEGINYLKKWLNIKQSFKWYLTFSIILIFALVSWKQVKYWENSITLFSRAIQITTDNYLAIYNLGTAFFEKNEYKKADCYFRESIKIAPDFAEPHFSYGVSLTIQNNIPEAIKQYQLGLEIKPNDLHAHINIADIYYRIGKYYDALNHYVEAYRIDNMNYEALNGMRAVKGKKDLIDAK